MVQTAPHGAWASPIAPADVARSASTPSWVALHGGRVWWTRSRPDQDGRQELVRDGDDGPRPVLGPRWNVRNRVHEYGGRPFTLLGEHVVFTEWSDQRLYTALPGGDPVALTAVPDREHGVRYSDLTAAGDAVWCVRETVTGDGPTDVTRDLVAVDLDGGLRVLGATHRFMSAPQPSPSGKHAAWIGWDHPDMPWDAAQLCVAGVTADGFGPHRVVAGGAGVAVCQVAWEAEDSLLALLDPHGWWNLHRIGLDGTAVPLAGGEHELGGPLWQLGQRWFAPLGRGRHAVFRAGTLAVLDERSGTVTDVDTDYPVVGADLHTDDTGLLATRGAGPTTPWTVFTLDFSTGEHTALDTPTAPDPRYIPIPERRTVRGDGHDVPVLVYPPTNPDATGPAGERPPWLLFPHSGPTTASSSTLDLDVAFFTSRGIGVVKVDYAGSTGHGRAFRELLYGQWGILDVADTIAAAQDLIARGEADPQRLAVRGGSAGGFTAAAAMTDGAVFACATLMFPLLDLAPWADGDVETHDFESRYVERLVGSLPEHADRYRDRSPVGKADQVRGPVLVLQGADDPVCPPEQVERFVKALRVPHAYLSFAGERHGFRRAESITAAYEAELSFYGQVFGFTPPATPTLELSR